MSFVEPNGERHAQRVSVRRTLARAATRRTVSQITFGERSAAGTLAGRRFGHVLVRPDSDLARLPTRRGGSRRARPASASTTTLPPFSWKRMVPRLRSTSCWRTCAAARRLGLEIGEYGDGEELLLPVLAGGEHPGDLVVGNGHDVALLLAGRSRGRLICSMGLVSMHPRP